METGSLDAGAGFYKKRPSTALPKPSFVRSAGGSLDRYSLENNAPRPGSAANVPGTRRRPPSKSLAYRGLAAAVVPALYGNSVEKIADAEVNQLLPRSTGARTHNRNLLVRPSTGGFKRSAQSVLLPIDLLHKLEEKRLHARPQSAHEAFAKSASRDDEPTEMSEPHEDGRPLIFQECQATLEEYNAVVSESKRTNVGNTMQHALCVQKLADETFNRVIELALMDSADAVRLLQTLRNSYSGVFDTCQTRIMELEKFTREARMNDEADQHRVELLKRECQRKFEERDQTFRNQLAEAQATAEQEKLRLETKLQQCQDNNDRMQSRLDAFNGIFRNFQKAYESDTRKQEIVDLKERVTQADLIIEEKSQTIDRLKTIEAGLREEVQYLIGDNDDKLITIEKLQGEVEEKEKYGVLYNEVKYETQVRDLNLMQGEVKLSFLQKRLEDMEICIQDHEREKELRKEEELIRQQGAAEREARQAEEKLLKEKEAEEHRIAERKFMTPIVGMRDLLPPNESRIPVKPVEWIIDTLRTILNDKVKAYHCTYRAAGLINRLPEFVWNWFSCKNKSWEETCMDCWTLTGGLSLYYNDFVEVKLFRLFLEEGLSIDELIFYMYCRKCLLGTDELKDLVMKVTMDDCMKCMKDVMPGIDFMVLVTLKNSLIQNLAASDVIISKDDEKPADDGGKKKKGAKGKKKKKQQVFDCQLFLQFMLRVYKMERDKRVEAIQQMFEAATNGKKEKMNILQFSHIMKTVNHRIKDVEIMKLFRACDGKDLSTPKFMQAADRLGFFVSCLRLPDMVGGSTTQMSDSDSTELMMTMRNHWVGFKTKIEPFVLQKLQDVPIFHSELSAALEQFDKNFQKQTGESEPSVDPLSLFFAYRRILDRVWHYTILAREWVPSIHPQDAGNELNQVEALLQTMI